MRTEDLVSRGRGWLRRGELALESSTASIVPVARAVAGRRQRELDRAWAREGARKSLAEDIGVGTIAFSQNDEDRILAGIFEALGEGERCFVEIGASDGSENCTRNLAEKGWKGLWIEGDPVSAHQAREVAPAGVTTLAAGVTAANAVGLLEQHGVPAAPDLLVLDIDGNDWWVLRALLHSFSPRVLVVEYNAAFRSGDWWTIRYRDQRLWDGTFRHGASLMALHSLVSRFGYGLLGCDSRGVNAFFLRTDSAAALAPRLGSSPVHYTAPWFTSFPYGHPRSRRVFRPMLALSPQELGQIELLPGPQPAPAGPVRAGTPVFVQACIRNGTGVALSSGGPAAITMSLRIFDDEGSLVKALPRTPLPCLIRAGRTGLATLWARVPSASGRYRIEMTLVQEWVAWFTDLPGGNRSVSLPVEVAGGAPLPLSNEVAGSW